MNHFKNNAPQHEHSLINMRINTLATDVSVQNIQINLYGQKTIDKFVDQIHALCFTNRDISVYLGE